VTGRHLLVTNDFPPKVGGIQSYLWELWRRLDPDSFTVLTASSDPSAAAFDAEQARAGYDIVRVGAKHLYLPTDAARRRIRQVVADRRASLVVLDPALPLAMVGPSLGTPYGVVLHGAEVTIPGRLPVTRRLLAGVLRHATLVISAGGYPAEEARRAARGLLPTTVEIPPGVDTERFRPIGPAERPNTRHLLGLPPDGLLVASVSRLVPRKGMDTLIAAAAALATTFPDLTVAIAGDGRDRPRLERAARRAGAPVRFMGHVSEDDKAALLGAADLFVMACRNRWAGLEQEGFGIVFAEAAAAGVAQVAGDSGGAAEAVSHGETGLVVRHPHRWQSVAEAIRVLLTDTRRREVMGAESRRRAVASFDYGRLAPRLAAALAEVRVLPESRSAGPDGPVPPTAGRTRALVDADGSGRAGAGAGEEPTGG
jgi:phosphatidylinositol alpha-1,6-mannosyltransferase